MINKITKLDRKTIFIIGSATYLALLVLALLYYKERVIFTDVAFILFQLILEGDYAIQVQRFVSVFTQSFGLFASKLGLPLNWVAMIHSAGFIIYYYLIFLLLLKLKARSLALGLVLYNVLMVTLSFYWIPSELMQAVAFVFLYLALLHKLLQREENSILLLVSSFLCLVTAVFGHPLIIFAVLFGILFFALHEKKKYLLIVSQLLLAVAIYVFKGKVYPNYYDNQAKEGLSNLIDFFKKIDLSSMQDFFTYLYGDYILLSISLLAVLSFYLYQKKPIKFLLVVVFFVGYSIVVNVAQAYLRSQYYIESQYLILSVITLLPLTFDILPKLKRNLTLAILAMVITISLIRIQQAHKPFTERVDWYRNYLEKSKDYETKKIVLHKDQMPMDVLLEHWGTAYEVWLLSTIETGETRSIVVIESEDELKKVFEKQRKQQFIAKFNQVFYKDLNPRYFILKDTSSYYQKLPTR